MVLHEKFPLEGVDGLMLQLQDEVEKVILKMAAVFQNRKDQLIFLINNYDMMLSVLSVSHWVTGSVIRKSFPTIEIGTSTFILLKTVRRNYFYFYIWKKIYLYYMLKFCMSQVEINIMSK